MRRASMRLGLSWVVSTALAACGGASEGSGEPLETNGTSSAGTVSMDMSTANPDSSLSTSTSTASDSTNGSDALGATQTEPGTGGLGASSSNSGTSAAGATAADTALPAGTSAGGATVASSSAGTGGASGVSDTGSSAEMGDPNDGMTNGAGGMTTGTGAGGRGNVGQAGASATAMAGSANSGGSGNLAAGGAGGSSDEIVEVDQSTLPNVTLHLAGDSTVMTYDAGSAQEGWGQELGQFFIDKVSINNQAIGGASIRTFQTGRWTNIMSALGAGDYVMIQFGANDSGTVQGRHVDPPDFAAALNEMVDDVESKQATAILVTPSALQEWSGGVQGNARLGPYVDAMREVGPMRSVLVDDLNARSVEYLNMIGQTAAQEIYIDGDKAHFTKTGAIQMAQFVAEELERIASPLAAYLNR